MNATDVRRWAACLIQRDLSLVPSIVSSEVLETSFFRVWVDLSIALLPLFHWLITFEG